MFVSSACVGTRTDPAAALSRRRRTAGEGGSAADCLEEEGFAGRVKLIDGARLPARCIPVVGTRLDMSSE